MKLVIWTKDGKVTNIISDIKINPGDIALVLDDSKNLKRVAIVGLCSNPYVIQKQFKQHLNQIVDINEMVDEEQSDEDARLDWQDRYDAEGKELCHEAEVYHE
uniref:Uncharacterized protein n=2 Tax=viral metagenome TaxID=1070528 RepID=A0A6M3XPX2_9ZZZZ